MQREIHHNPWRLTDDIVLWLSAIVVLMLTILPLPRDIAWFRPNWALLYVIYWAVWYPHRFQVGTAWLMGLFKDVLLGTLLGQNAILLAFATYFATKLDRRIHMFPLWQQAGVVFIFALIVECLMILIQGMVGGNTGSWLGFLSPCITALLWPWFSTLLHMCNRQSGLD